MLFLILLNLMTLLSVLLTIKRCYMKILVVIYKYFQSIPPKLHRRKLIYSWKGEERKYKTSLHHVAQ